MEIKLGDISTISAFLGTVILFAGIVKIYTYFKVFNTSIIDYIDLSEIVTLFIDNLMGYILVIILTVPASLDFFNKLKIETSFFDTFCQLDFHQRLVIYKSQILNIIIYGMMLISLSGVYYTFRKKITFKEFCFISIFILTIIIMAPILSIELKIWLSNGYKVIFSVFTILFYLSILLIVVYAIGSALNESSKVKKGYYSKMIFEFDTGVISCSKSFYYIGRTRNYIFFYNSQMNASIIIPSSRLKGIINKI